MLIRNFRWRRMESCTSDRQIHSSPDAERVLVRFRLCTEGRMNTLADLYVYNILRKLYHQRFISDEISEKVQSILTKMCSLLICYSQSTWLRETNREYHV
jgi:SUMO ligase MMS21 Smc5/6 complex component